MAQWKCPPGKGLGDFWFLNYMAMPSDYCKLIFFSLQNRKNNITLEGLMTGATKVFFFFKWNCSLQPCWDPIFAGSQLQGQGRGWVTFATELSLSLSSVLMRLWALGLALWSWMTFFLLCNPWPPLGCLSASFWVFSVPLKEGMQKWARRTRSLGIHTELRLIFQSFFL